MAWHEVLVRAGRELGLTIVVCQKPLVSIETSGKISQQKKAAC